MTTIYTYLPCTCHPVDTVQWKTKEIQKSCKFVARRQ